MTAVAATIAVAVGAAGAAPSLAGTDSGTELVLRGRGHGHGVGMTHDGALALGVQGKSAEQILALFYPGTTLGRASATVRVLVHDGAGTAQVRLPAGGVLRPDKGPVAGLPLRLAPGAVVTVSASAGRVAATASPSAGAAPVTASAPGALLVIPESSAELGGRSHRGLLRVLGTQGRLRGVVHVDVESYLRGMGEVRDATWPQASLRAQAIAARTYAIHAVRYSPRDPDFDLYSDDRSQVYLGAHAEYSAMSRAVEATTGRVLRYDGAIANAVYSTNGGGVTATPLEGFGRGPRHPYLTAVRYPTRDPLAWTHRQPLGQVARELGYRGRITAFDVVRNGPSGRALTVRVSGTAGRVDLTGLAVAERLGLRSTLFTVAAPASSRPARRPTMLPRLAPGVEAAPLRAAAALPATTSPASTPSRRAESVLAGLLLAGALTALLRQPELRRQKRGGSV